MKNALEIAKLSWKKSQRDQMQDRAAGMTYNTLMAIFPAMLVAIAILGLIGKGSTYNSIIDQVSKADADLGKSIKKLLDNAAAHQGSAWTATIFGVLLGLNGASGALAAAGRGLNVVLGVEEDRGFVKRKLLDVGWTLLLIVLGLITLVLVFGGGSLADAVFNKIGIGSTGAFVWSIVRWPLGLAGAMAIYGIVYFVAPDAEERKFRYLSPGAISGVLLWILASALFFLYVKNFSSYGKTYGAFATAVILLIFLYITNIALLFGAEVNAVLDEKKHGVSHAPESMAVAGQQLGGHAEDSSANPEELAQRQGASGPADGSSPAARPGSRGPGTRPASRPRDRQKVGAGWVVAAIAVMALRGRPKR